jgi:hypothetical protein
VPDPHNHGADAGKPSGSGCHLPGSKVGTIIMDRSV